MQDLVKTSAFYFFREIHRRVGVPDKPDTFKLHKRGIGFDITRHSNIDATKIREARGVCLQTPHLIMLL